MSAFNRSGLMSLQVAVGTATVAATVVMFLHPECIEHMLAEVARAVVCGLLMAGVKVLVKVSRPKMACRPVSCWWCYGWAVVRHEFRCGLVSGYLLGLIVAMWFCGNG